MMRASSRSYTIGFVLVLVAGVAFGSIGIGGKYAVDGGASTSTILLVRFVIAATLLWLALPMLGHQMRLPQKQAWGFFLLGAIPEVIVSYAFIAALQYRLSVGATVLLYYVYPALVVAAAMLLGRERLSLGRLAAVGMSFAGCALVMGSLGQETFDAIGIGWALLAALGGASYVLLADWLLEDNDPLVAGAHVQAGTAAVMVVLTATLGGVSLNVSASAWLAMLGITAGGNLIGMTAILAGLRRVGASVAAIGAMLEVLVTVILGVILFAEPLGSLRLVGGALILGAVALAQHEGRRDARGAGIGPERAVGAD